MGVCACVCVCAYRHGVGDLVQAECRRQHGGADGKAGAAGIAALPPRMPGGVPPTLPSGDLRLLLYDQDLVIA